MPVVPPYTGQNQPTQIVVPRTTQYQQVWEESCWVMPPYANLFPNGEGGGVAFLPPPIQTTDLWSAMQKWPL